MSVKRCLVLLLFTACGVEVISHSDASRSLVIESDWCADRLSGFDNRWVPPPERPSLLTPVVDPVFGTTVVRISESSSGATKTSLDLALPGWNADESRLLVRVSGSNPTLLLDGHSYELIEPLTAVVPSSTGEIMWHPTDPDVLFFFDPNGRLIRYSISTRQSTTVFGPDSRCPTLRRGTHSPSRDARVFGVLCVDAADARALGILTLDAGLALQPTPLYEPPIVAPEGTAVASEQHVYDSVFHLTRDLAFAPSDVEGSIAIGPDGGSLFLARNFGARDTGSLVGWPLTGAPATIFIGPATGAPYPLSGTQVSTTAFANPRWALVSSLGSDEPLAQELLLADLSQPGRFCRLAHHHSTAQTAPALSPTASRAIFTSNWGGQTDTYVVEFGRATPVPQTNQPATLQQYSLGCETSPGWAWAVLGVWLARRRANR